MKKTFCILLVLALLTLTGCLNQSANRAMTINDLKEFDKTVTKLTREQEAITHRYEQSFEKLSTGELTKQQVMAVTGEASKATENLLKQFNKQDAPGDLADIASDYKVYLMSQRDGFKKAGEYLKTNNVNLWGDATEYFSVAGDYKKRSFDKLANLKVENGLK